MAEIPKRPIFKFDPKMESELKAQKEALVHIKRISEETKALGEPTPDLDEAIAVIDTLIDTTLVQVDRLKKLFK